MTSLPADDQAQERLDPDTAEEDLYAEHVARYQFAMRFAAGKRVLDCASGFGYGAALLASVARSVIGIDNAPEAVERARHQFARRNVAYLVADGRSLPLGNGCVDLVVSFETIEHAPHPERFVAEFRRVLAPAGVLVLSTPNIDVYRHEDGVDNPFHQHEFKVSELELLLRRYFPKVVLNAERHQSSVVIGPPEPAQMATWFGDAREPNIDVLKRSPYVVAVCGRKSFGPVGLVRLATGGSRVHELIGWARNSVEELGRARERIADLEHQLEERTTWAKDLDGELNHARGVVADVQDQLVERTEWARSLEAEAVESRRTLEERVPELQHTVEERTHWAQELERIADERTVWAHDLERELQHARGVVTDLQRELRERTEWARQLEAQLSASRAAAAHLRKQLDKRAAARAIDSDELC